MATVSRSGRELNVRGEASPSLDGLETDLIALEKMSLQELRAFWSDRWGIAPRLRSVGLLRLMIAWRLQAVLFGGLDAETKRLLRMKSIPRAPLPPVGSRLTREYQGRPHEVQIAEDGFIYEGCVYRSLSEVARLITGTRWNGPRFFGLRDGAQRP
jgi:hypothetical protein